MARAASASFVAAAASPLSRSRSASAALDRSTALRAPNVLCCLAKRALLLCCLHRMPAQAAQASSASTGAIPRTAGTGPLPKHIVVPASSPSVARLQCCHLGLCPLRTLCRLLRPRGPRHQLRQLHALIMELLAQLLAVSINRVRPRALPVRCRLRRATGRLGSPRRRLCCRHPPRSCVRLRPRRLRRWRLNDEDAMWHKRHRLSHHRHSPGPLCSASEGGRSKAATGSLPQPRTSAAALASRASAVATSASLLASSTSLAAAAAALSAAAARVSASSLPRSSLAAAASACWARSVSARVCVAVERVPARTDSTSAVARASCSSRSRALPPARRASLCEQARPGRVRYHC